MFDSEFGDVAQHREGDELAFIPVTHKAGYWCSTLPVNVTLEHVAMAGATWTGTSLRVRVTDRAATHAILVVLGGAGLTVRDVETFQIVRPVPAARRRRCAMIAGVKQWWWVAVVAAIGPLVVAMADPVGERFGWRNGLYWAVGFLVTLLFMVIWLVRDARRAGIHREAGGTDVEQSRAIHRP